jgi:protein SCO1/2
MRGALTLYTFAHSHCEQPCVTTNTSMAALRPALSAMELEGIPLRFVTIYVDPESATPEVLAAEAQRMGADGEQWRFVTGDAEQLKSVIGAGFNTFYGQNASGGYTVDPVFVLVDSWGIMRATYRTLTPDVNRLQRDLGLVVQEAANSTGVNRYAYEAAHLFMCYPK